MNEVTTHSDAAPTQRISCYADTDVVLLTRHGKERVIAPILEAMMGCRVRLDNGYDTDRLGTFSRDVPRRGTQLDAARAKARIGMERTGLSFGLGSEGSFGPDPQVGLLPWNVEVIVFIDSLRDLEVVGMAQGKACFAHLPSGRWSEVEAFAAGIGFPQQQLIMRPHGPDEPQVHKDIGSWAELKAAYAWASSRSADGRVFVETDGRAHANPTRMASIRVAAEDLARKLASPCPSCNLPGYWLLERLPGLPCVVCEMPTKETRAEVYGCLKCGYRQTFPSAGRNYADAGRCDYCNP